MTPENSMITLSAITLGWTVFWSIFIYRQVNGNRLNEIIAAHHDRIVKVEAQLTHLPHRVASHEDVGEVHDRVSQGRKELGVQIDTVRADVKVIGEYVAGIASSIKGIEGNLTLLNKSEFLINRGKKS
ncbi:MAG: hypothetical protein COW30_02505 [Rhodospirillales bacterium CG15_BIG_FIL_POST_REV_8_21_14_020_66_15]|nr:MAG: hypothetical protein COW30_02505 [Rhodospirillales bacterium CG15_BIG_FIL_POST_REV_8_21_14_020_66_15]